MNINFLYGILFLVYAVMDFFTVSNYKKQIKNLTDENRDLRRKITNENIKVVEES